VTDIACWINFFADGARRNSSRWDLYSRLGNAALLRADGMIILLKKGMYGNSPYLASGAPTDQLAAASARHLELASF
jgi:hypothetical protein